MPASIKEFEQFLKQHAVQGMALDSRMIHPGDLFIAVEGSQPTGVAFIEHAVQKGAVAVLLESQAQTPDLNIPVLKISDLKTKIPSIAAYFFQTPLEQIQFIGVTGTKGKTTTSYWIAHFLNALENPCGLIGSLGYGFVGKLKLGTHTTPDPVNLYRHIHELYKNGARHIAMEVSSHALSQDRVQGLRFETGVFTNLGHDHLDYHRTPSKYLRAKEKLFETYSHKNVIFNTDDLAGKKLFEKFKKHPVLNAYSVSLKSLKNRAVTQQGICAQIQSPFGSGKLEAPILGEFNLYNLLAAMQVASLQGVAFKTILEKAKTLPPVPGRMEWLCEKNMPTIVIDYAHTPEALKAVLETLRTRCAGKLWVVFGCGGDRDRSKRAKMVQIAETLSDHVILTEDNPRHEDPNHIFSDLLKGAQAPDAINLEPNRTNAINLAIQVAQTNDCILVAGKGDEPYNLVGDQRIPYQDRLVVLDALARRKKAHA